MAGGAGCADGGGTGAVGGARKGTWVGALIGRAIGAGAVAFISNEIDKKKKALEAELASVRGLAEQNARVNDQQNAQIADNTYRIQTIEDSNKLKAIKIVLGNAILFNTGSAQLSPLAKATLSRIAYNLNQFPESDMAIVGFTDNTGTVKLNNTLSLQRAQSVMNYLISQGVSSSRLSAYGDGENNPIASNETAQGRAQNRRVEMYITAGKQMIENYQNQN